jgi:hypothetical protein
MRRAARSEVVRGLSQRPSRERASRSRAAICGSTATKAAAASPIPASTNGPGLHCARVTWHESQRKRERSQGGGVDEAEHDEREAERPHAGTLRLICRRAHGFHSADALIALAMLAVGGLRPSLPGRTSNPRIR